MFLCPRSCWRARVSWPSFASLNPQAWRSMCGWIGNGILATSPSRWMRRWNPIGLIGPPRSETTGNARGTLEGSRRAFSADFIRTLADDFRLYGRQAIEKVRKQQPAAYMKICALLVPREMKVEHSNAIKELTDEQLEAMIEHLKASLEAQAQSAKVIDGELVDAAALPAPDTPAR